MGHNKQTDNNHYHHDIIKCLLTAFFYDFKSSTIYGVSTKYGGKRLNCLLTYDLIINILSLTGFGHFI